jgi:hypothetical protein
MRSQRNDIGTYSKKMDLFLPVIIYQAFRADRLAEDIRVYFQTGVFLYGSAQGSINLAN